MGGVLCGVRNVSYVYGVPGTVEEGREGGREAGKEEGDGEGRGMREWKREGGGCGKGGEKERDVGRERRNVK